MPVLFNLEDPLAAEKMEALLVEMSDDELELYDSTALPDEAFWS